LLWKEEADVLSVLAGSSIFPGFVTNYEGCEPLAEAAALPWLLAEVADATGAGVGEASTFSGIDSDSSARGVTDNSFGLTSSTPTG